MNIASNAKNKLLSYFLKVAPILAVFGLAAGSVGAQTVATPTFTPGNGYYNTGQTVTIGTTTAGASIRYTIDGSVPSETTGILYGAPITLAVATTINAIAYANGMTDSSIASATFIISGTAQFVNADVTSLGSWKGVYGSNGYNVVEDTTAYPGYVTVTPSGQSNYVWSSSLSQLRALQKAESATDRIAATWYSGGSFSINMTFTDTATHQMAMYFLDWDGGRTQTVDVLDAATNNVLDSRNLTDFYHGEYLVWNMTGPVTVIVTQTGPYNAVVSGLFFDPLPPVVTPQFSPVPATYIQAQTVTLSTTTPAASIRYTMDGSTPSETVGTEYSSPIAVSATTTIKAIAYRGGLPDSVVSTATYTITPAWYDTSWSNRRSITIDHTKVVGSSNLTNFPVLVSMTDANLATLADGGNVGLPDGGDILFTASDGVTKLAHEIESYNGSTGRLTAWVNVPTVSPTGDAMIYLYYGNDSTGDQANKTAVWDSNFQEVLHMDESSGTTLFDSTANGNNGSKVSVSSPAATSAGEIAGAQSFNGTSDFVVLPPSMTNGLPMFSVSFWTQTTDTGSNGTYWNRPQFVGDASNGNASGDFGINTNSGDLGIWSGLNSAGDNSLVTSSVINDNNWHHVCAINDGSTIWLYLDGQYTGQWLSSGLGLDGLGWYLGAQHYLSGNSANFYHQGSIDEFRFSNSARSAAWVGTEYANQSSPSTFYSVGSQQGSGAPPRVAPPTFSPAAGTFTSAQTVTISTETTGASINYTLDGSTPSETAGTLYSGPITVSATTTINAIAFASGMTDSAVSSATYTIAGSGWYNTSWSDRKSITIDHTKVVGSSSLTSFPVLISVTDPNLATVANGGNVGLPDGSDILFTALDGVTKLNHEIEEYNPATGQLIAWVNVPTMSPTVNTVIYIYYGNASASNQQNAAGVWDSNYTGVWHLPNSSTLTANDSTSNGNNASSLNGTSATNGKIGGGASFNGTGNFIQIPNSASLNGWSQQTISLWMNAQTDMGSYARLVEKGANNEWTLAFNYGGVNQQLTVQNLGANTPAITTSIVAADDTWHKVDVTLDNGTGRLTIYVDGLLDGSGISSSSASTTTNDIFIGQYGGGGYYFHGLIDELEISNTVRSAGWIGTLYANQSSPSTFYSVGSQQGSGAPPRVAPPTFSPAAGTFTSAQTVTISTETTGASINYTLDGSTPSETAGTLYSGPITVSATTTINAIAFASGMTDSAVSSATYTIAGSGWYNTSWSDRKSITIDHTKVVGSSSLTSFPVLISVTDPNLATVANGGNVGLPDGSDILFTALDGVTKLNHEIEEYNPATGQLIAWVNVPTMSPTVNTVIYIYYGNASASNQQNAAGVWDSNYTGVWHLPNGTSLSASDSTSGGSNGAVSGAAAVAGKIDGGASFTGSSQISFNDSSQPSAASARTLSTWINSTSTNNSLFLDYGDATTNGAQVYLGVYDLGEGFAHEAIVGVGGGNSNLGSHVNVNDGIWHYVVATDDGSNNWNIYVDGVLTNSATPLGATTNTVVNYTATFGTAEDGTQAYTGLTDEIRVSNIARSTSWIATEYNNQNSPSTFFSLGSQQGAGAPAQVATPAFTPGAGTYASAQTVTISTGTSGASIRYTTDGSTPNETAGTLYSAPIAVSSTTTISAIAYESGMTDSAVASAVYNIVMPPPSISSLSPLVGPVGTFVTISGSNFGASQGGSSVTFNGVGAITVLSWSSSSITVAVPAAAATGNVVVTVGGVSSNGTSFTVNASFVSTNGVVGSQRSSHTATRLTNGNVLIAGGTNSSGVLATAELYTPASQTFITAGSMTTQRWMHSATLLNDGTVLIAGGSNVTTGTTLNSAEIYDPVAGTFTLLSNTLNTARAGQTATLLNNGQVLLVGGIDPTAGIIQDAELYDPPSQTFIDLGDTTTPRYRHTATILKNGQVLIAGGETDPTLSGAYNTAEIFDPVAQVFTPVLVPMTSSREGHAAVLLNNGQVLIAGGDNPGTGSQNSAEIYNPSLGVFTPLTATMTAPRISHTMTVLNGGKVLITGGATDSGGSTTVLNTAELFDPTSQIFVSAGTMTSVREHDSVSLINDGTVLLAGGTDGTNIFNSAELYLPSQLTGLVSIAVTPASPSIGVGGQQSFIATGTFSDGSTQTLASVLWSSSSTTVAPVSGDSTDAGVANAATQGTTTIAASAAGVTGSATLTVTAATLASITLSPQASVIALGGTLQFAATGNYSDGSTQDLTSIAAWTSSNGTIATISGGLATGLLQGTVSIQVSYGSLSATTNLSVGTPTLVSITINPTTATIPVGTNQQYQVLGTYSNGSVQDVTTLMDWSSSTTSVANVGITGLATSVAQGSSTITAAFESLSVSSSLTVNPPVLASIAISPDAASISNGGSQQLKATGTYTDGSTQDLTASSTWVSSNTAAVTVNSSGLATAIGSGNSTITATTGSTVGTTVLIVTSPTTGASLNTSRYEHSAITLINRQVLIAGGVTCPTSGSCSYLTSAEIYDPGSDTFTTTGSLATARSAPAVLLNTGKVLVAGGYTCDTSGNCSSLSSVELYDPNAGTFNSAGTMTHARSGHTMTLLGNGTVLISGGENCTSATSCSATSTAEIYDPVAGTFTATSNSMSAARFGASAVALNSGQVLISGGFDGTNLPAAAEVFNPTNNGFTGTGPNLNAPRFGATSTLLNNGQVLVAGGSTCALPGCPTNAAEIYDPVANTFSTVSGGMTVSRFNQSATLTTNGQVYVAGGFSSCGSSCTSEATTDVFDPVAGTFSSGESVTNALAGQTGTLTANGSVLLVGGVNDGVTLSGDQWYQPATLTPSGLVSISVTPASVFLTPGQTQQFVATGTFSGGGTQILQSVIWTSSNPSIAVVNNSPGSAGLVSALTAGTPVITATAGDAGGSSSVGVATLVSITIFPTNPSLPADWNQQFTASGTFSDGSTHDITASATWSSSNSSAVSIGNSGGSQGLAITGAIAGTATITATLGTTSANTSVTVLAIPATPVIVSVSPGSGTAGTQVTITGTGFGSVQGTGTVLLGTNPAAVVSWSSTQIVATVATGSRSGSAQVQQNGNWSNTVSFGVATATISSITPNNGVPGTQVIIRGSGFGAVQGNGQVWLGTANGVVEEWSDTEVVAVVAIGSTTGSVQVLQNGVMSNVVVFTVNTPHTATVSPTSGAAGASITITGTGFGSTQGTGNVWLGSTTAGQILSWSNTQIVATVAAGSVSGVERVLQNGEWSNALPFTVPGGSVTLVPNIINMMVGDTHTIEALNSSGQSVTGLTWTSSNTNVVTLSTDDPPILTAVGVGRSTITAGGASADITVSPMLATGLPLGTVLCSNPSDGSGVASIVPAVPSPTGVADVFAIQNDGTVAAINSDCTTAWTANLGDAMTNGQILPDFQSGLLLLNGDGNGSITKLDGITGQPYPTYTPASGSLMGYGSPSMVVHPNGTVFTLQYVGPDPQGNYQASMVGVNPLTGAQEFSVPVGPSGPTIFEDQVYGQTLMIAGDGYAYVAYSYGVADPHVEGWHLHVLRVNTAGQSDDIDIQDFVLGPPFTLGDFSVAMITNVDTGVLVSWQQGAYYLEARPGQLTPKYSQNPYSYGMAVTTGTTVTSTNDAGMPPNGFITPVLQLQDGSFVGTVQDQNNAGQTDMVGFDSSGNVRWTVPNERPQIATADGGVIGQSGITYDQSGNATGQTTIPSAYSWLGYSYQIGSTELWLLNPLDFALSFQAFAQNSRKYPASTGTAAKLVQSKTFIPSNVLLGQAATFPASYNNAVKSGIPATKVAVDILWGSETSANGFLKALETTNSVVAFIGHAPVYDTVGWGLCFGANSYQCLTLPAVANGLSRTGLVLTSPYQMIPLPTGFAPKAKVVFIAACGITDPVVSQWNIGPEQALIVPIYLNQTAQVTDTAMNLYDAALEWEEILTALAEGQNVTQAVAAGNAAASSPQLNNTSHRWKVIGNGNVKIR